MPEKIRLQKYFTDCGILSRRRAEEEIANGNVLVNRRVASLGDKITPGVDRVEYRGKEIIPRPEHSFLYILFNKPRGVVTTTNDEKGRRNVTDYFKHLGVRIYPVGRLDMDSDGLLLLTDDGDFTNHLTHPRHEIPKIYHVRLSQPPTGEQIRILSSPMELDGYRLQPVRVERLGDTLLQMTLFEGRNRQIRRMCESVGLTVASLTRIAIGDLKLGDLPTGKWRYLTDEEVSYLFPNRKTEEV